MDSNTNTDATGLNGSAPAREPITTNVIDVSVQDHYCTRNYDGSSGGMESEGLLLLMKKIDAKYEGELYLDTVVTDDDTKMKKYITHAEYKPRGWKNHGGSLPNHIPAPKWFADPTHRAKCVAGAFFEMTKGPKSSTRATKLDALRMKKYYSYFIKQNCKKDINWLLEHAMAPLNHLFDDHPLCDSSWCHKKKALDNADQPPVDDKEERNKKTYYRSKVDDDKLFDAMKIKYTKYISKEYLQHCMHSFDTQINEGMNNSCAAYANKGKHYGGTSSLLTRVLIAAGVHLVGYHHFWTSCLNLLEVKIPHQFHLHLLAMDKEKVARYHRDHDFKNKAKRKKLEHEKFYNEYVAHQKDVARNLTYESRTGCADAPKTTSTCVHGDFGCDGKKKHKTEQSQHCDYHLSKRGGMTIVEARRIWIEKHGDGTNMSCTYANLSFYHLNSICTSKSVLFRDIVPAFIAVQDSNTPYKSVGNGIAQNKNDKVLHLAQNTKNSNLESASVVEDFDSIFQTALL